MSELQADRQVRLQRNYAAHAAQACATVAGLWLHVAKGPFDGLHLQQGGEKCYVVVVRSFGRMVRGDGLVDRVIGQAFEARAASWPGFAKAAGGAASTEPESLVVVLVDSFTAQAGEGVLRYRPPKDDPPPELPPVRARPAFVAMLRFIASGFIRLPGAEPEPGDDLQPLTHGLNDAFEGGEDPEPDGDDTRRARVEAEDALRRMGITAAPPTSPGLWQELRGTCFGLVDGGDLPPFLPPPMEGDERAIITNKALVVPPPGDYFTLAAVLPEQHADHPRARQALRSCDPYQAAKARAWLTDRITEARAARVSGTEGPSLVAKLESTLGHLDAWLAPRSRSFAWLVATHLADQLDAARQSLQADLGLGAAGRPAEPDQASRRRAHRRLQVWWTLSFLVACGLAAVALWNPSGRSLGGAVVVLGASVVLLGRAPRRPMPSCARRDGPAHQTPIPPRLQAIRLDVTAECPYDALAILSSPPGGGEGGDAEAQGPDEDEGGLGLVG